MDGLVRIETGTVSGIETENWTRSEIEKKSRIRVESGNASGAENGTGVETQCGDGVEINRVTGMFYVFDLLGFVPDFNHGFVLLNRTTMPILKIHLLIERYSNIV
ncbi:hypothetical protein EVAR_62173_1 [Eumeta japonica]|uniref:Uncharacterized protein n=1 Tax=Eumeta variegata TaxID=151549 RepID=A0A4C1ZVH9_EUMVA|nr:hypothetical protein EVAR_62173_1 [Eumeta japonica]